MNTVIDSLFLHHDLRLVALAAGLCLISAFAGMTLLAQARLVRGRRRSAWIAVAALSVGFGIWTTQFVGMLAFSAGMPPGYDILLTVASLLAAITMTGAGFAWTTIGGRPSDAAFGGAIVGAGIAIMHYIGVFALLIGGAIVWNVALVWPLLIGITLGGLALWIAARRSTMRWRVAGSAVLAIAMCATHFAGMGALGLESGFPVVGLVNVSPVELALGVAATSLFILLLALAAVYLDMRDRRHAGLELLRMHGLVDAAVEALMIVAERTIVTANRSFLSLAGSHLEAVAGTSVFDFIDQQAFTSLAANPSVPIESNLRRRDQTLVPIEAVVRTIDYDGKRHSVVVIRDLTERKRAEEHIQFIAHHDVLTGLANRASFSRRLEGELADARRQELRFAVLSVDLDRFKEVNDQFGHAAGDKLLQRVANAITTTLGDRDFAARLGGDEFCLILPDITAPAAAGRMAEQLLEAFDKNNTAIADGTVISASIGIVIYPEDADTAEGLMLNANVALYQAKHDGGGVYRYFEKHIGVEVRERRELEADLRTAIAHHQLRVVYQPQSELNGGAVSGFEALVRWDHPVRGPIPPSLFIPVAEECGLIAQIDSWVLRTACAEAASWQNKLAIAVNVSAVQLEDDCLPEMILATLTATGLAADRLELEITETALMRDMARALTNLAQIQALGVRIAMDDFGTGFSSLANLRAFPFDKIKIDQSFVASVDTNEQSAAIVRAVVALSGALKMSVIAEGIERPEELAFLKREHCGQAQGYLFGRPANIADYAHLTGSSGPSRLAS